MIAVIEFGIFFLLFFAFLYPSLAIFGYDVYRKKSKTLSKIIRWRRRERDIWSIGIFHNVLKIVAPLIPLSEDGERKMEDDLRRADIPYSAKEYYAKAILSSLLGVVIAIFAGATKFYLLVLCGLVISVWLFFKNYDQVKDTLKDKYQLIENEIPAFIRSIESGLRSDHDIIHVIERYNKIANPAMKSELEILLADMEASSVPQALMRFDSRMNSPEISRLCSALIEWERGVDSSQQLSYLATDMTNLHRELIQRELDKRPGKMKRAMMPSVIILIIMMFYMLLKAVVESASYLT